MLNVVQELCNLSAHNCLKVLGVLLKFCAEFPMNVSASCSTPFFRDRQVVVVPWWFRGVFCARFVLFERFAKLRETVIEQESLQAAYI